jgi:hypothetical protein
LTTDYTRSFFNHLKNEAEKTNTPFNTDLDPIAESVIRWLVGTERETIKISSSDLAKRINSTRQRVRSRIEGLARYGLIQVVTSWRQDGTSRRKPMEITLNPMLLAILKPGVKASLKMAAAKSFVAKSESRLSLTDENLQGFKDDVLYGDPDASAPFTEEQAELKLADVIAAEDLAKADRARENLIWRQHGDKFVEGCAEVWVYAQTTLGYGEARPNWEGKPGDLSPAARRERRELVKTFEMYGARVTGIAWLLFAGGAPTLDKDGRPVFNHMAPHIQYASTDKKPSFFSKHFNAVLKDPRFKTAATETWDTVSLFLNDTYGKVIEVGPREGDEYSKCGIIIGQITPEL